MTPEFEARWHRLPHVYAVVEASSGRFLRTAQMKERVEAGEVVVDLGIDTHPPDLVRERYDPTADDPERSPYHRRKATDAEVDEIETAIRDEVTAGQLSALVDSPVHEASLVYFERERYLDRNGRYPTNEELLPILARQRVVFNALLREVVGQRGGRPTA